MLKSYPKIIPLVGKYVDLAVGVDVEITEKVDGSMFAFGRDKSGNLYFRSKGAHIDPVSNLPHLFRPAVEYVLSIQDKIPNDTVFYGETLASRRHNTLTYDRIPKNHIALFGMFDFDRTRGVDHNSLREHAMVLNVDVVPLIYQGKLDSLKQYQDIIDSNRQSFLGGAIMEGIVVKDYTHPMEFAGQLFPLTVLKLVSEQFKEKHSSNPDWVPQRDKMEELLNRYRSEARWHKAVQHLREEDKLVGEPKDIGPLMSELWRDVAEEEKENFKEELWNMYKKRLAYKVQHGFPEWYKRSLLDSAS